MVEQRGFPHVRPTDDGDKTAVKHLRFGHGFSLIC
jgi:hypothetical protein